MKNICLILSLFLMLSSCGNSVVDKPDNLIDDDVMVDIFYDLALIDAAKNSSYGDASMKIDANNFIFKKYKIDSIQFAKSNKYYASDVAKYKRLYKIVRDRLNDKKMEIEQTVKTVKTE